MCVRICKHGQQLEYDMNKPLADQVNESDEIIVNFYENDKSVQHFLDAVEEFAKTAYGYGLNITVLHNNQIGGARAKKKMAEAAEDVSVNDIIRMMALIQYEADKRLSELVAICSGTKNE